MALRDMRAEPLGGDSCSSRPPFQVHVALKLSVISPTSNVGTASGGPDMRRRARLACRGEPTVLDARTLATALQDLGLVTQCEVLDDQALACS
jgi:hypothetical protein